jgi:hypothetical protein
LPKDFLFFDLAAVASLGRGAVQHMTVTPDQLAGNNQGFVSIPPYVGIQDYTTTKYFYFSFPTGSFAGLVAALNNAVDIGSFSGDPATGIITMRFALDYVTPGSFVYFMVLSNSVDNPPLAVVSTEILVGSPDTITITYNDQISRTLIYPASDYFSIKINGVDAPIDDLFGSSLTKGLIHKQDDSNFLHTDVVTLSYRKPPNPNNINNDINNRNVDVFGDSTGTVAPAFTDRPVINHL